jgi:hypothetical protein
MHRVGAVITVLAGHVAVRPSSLLSRNLGILFILPRPGNRLFPPTCVDPLN